MLKALAMVFGLVSKIFEELVEWGIAIAVFLLGALLGGSWGALLAIVGDAFFVSGWDKYFKTEKVVQIRKKGGKKKKATTADDDDDEDLSEEEREDKENEGWEVTEKRERDEPKYPSFRDKSGRWHPGGRRVCFWGTILFWGLTAIVCYNRVSAGVEALLPSGIADPTARHANAEEAARKIGEMLGHSPTAPKPNLGGRAAAPTAPPPAVIELTEEFKSVPMAFGRRWNMPLMGKPVVVRYSDGREFISYAYGTHPTCVDGDPDKQFCLFEIRDGKEIAISGFPEVPVKGGRAALQIKSKSGPAKVRLEYPK